MMKDQLATEFEAGGRKPRPASKCTRIPAAGASLFFFREITERKRAEQERLTTGKLESLGTLARRDCARPEQHSHCYLAVTLVSLNSTRRSKCCGASS